MILTIIIITVIIIIILKWSKHIEVAAEQYWCHSFKDLPVTVHWALSTLHLAINIIINIILIININITHRKKKYQKSTFWNGKSKMNEWGVCDVWIVKSPLSQEEEQTDKTRQCN